MGESPGPDARQAALAGSPGVVVARGLYGDEPGHEDARRSGKGTR
jgi:hypothetical protein